MTNAPPGEPKEADNKAQKEPPERTRPDAAQACANPLPGVMDFIGANVGGELAEERWR